VVETGGVRQDAGFQLLEGVKIGDYVIVHAGFAIQRLDEAEALETLALFKGLEKAS
jgi:hydrogenase expression/formation protein HypC